MIDFAPATAQLLQNGYTDVNVEEKLAQDILLSALSRSSLRDNVTLKGGVVMANLTGDIRRTTMDVDVDFVRLGIDDNTIREFVAELDAVSAEDGVSMSLVGDILELRQQDYRGKRVFLSLQDRSGKTLQAKIDIGVHVHVDVPQPEMTFNVGSVSSIPAIIPANSPEQVFVEKLKSLLRLGPISNRGKDVFDMAYLSRRVDKTKTKELLEEFVFMDGRMIENDLAGIVSRVRRTFSDLKFKARLSHRRSNWLDMEPSDAMELIIAFVESLA